MKLTKFRIQNYRSINDSGWVEVDDIATIVGKNESGKTSLLKALWKFNPFKEEPYSLDREWPRGRRKERSGDQPVCSAAFTYIDEELTQLCGIDDTTKHLNAVQITKKYDGSSTYSFYPKHPSTAT